MSAETPHLVIESRGEERFTLQDPTTIGRVPGNTLVLDDAGCSSRHAVIRREGGCWVLEDLGSTNGTWLGEEHLAGPRALREGDRIHMGAQTLRVAGLEGHCPTCGKEAAREAAYCQGCGFQLRASAPPPTVVMRPPHLASKAASPPPLPPAAPPSLPPPAQPPKKKRGCWLSCCLTMLILAILVAVAGWLLWDRFFGPSGSPLLGKAMAFRQAARFDTAGAMADWGETRARERMKALEENLWPAVNPGLGWAFFFETSVAAAGSSVEGHLPVLFYNPWADVALITVWTPAGRLHDLEVMAGDPLRRGGVPPLGGGRGWLTAGAYGPAAVGGLTARTLLAFESHFQDDNWTPDHLQQALPAWRDPRHREASSLACGLQLAQVFQELVAFSRAEDRSARTAYVELLRQGARGQAKEAAASAVQTPPEVAEFLEALPTESWAGFKVAAFANLGERALVMAHHSERPDLFLGVVMTREGSGYKPQRIDCMSFNACYDATR